MGCIRSRERTFFFGIQLHLSGATLNLAKEYDFTCLQVY